jgi:hypothetical protein
LALAAPARRDQRLAGCYKQRDENERNDGASHFELRFVSKNAD